jgi:ABC-type Na+ efflux pump permease subunit
VPGLTKLSSLLPAPSLDSNPVLWREWHRNRPSSWARSVADMFVALAVASSVVAVASRTPHGASFVNAFQVAVGLLLLSVTASTSLAEERARGSLDVLMATPMSTRQIVLGKWLGAFRLVPALAVLPTLVTFAEGGGNSMKWRVAILMTAYVIAVGAAVTSLGVALATWCSRLGRAVGLTVTVYVIVTVGWMFLIMAMMSPHPFGYALIAASPFFGPVVITKQLEQTQIDWGDVVAVVLWVGAYATASAALLAATLATFDRCLGRVKSGPHGRIVRGPEAVEPSRVEKVRGSEFVRK